MNITHGLRQGRCRSIPNGLAIGLSATRRRTWREVGERVARLAAGFRALGVNAGDRVAILSLNSDRYLELYLATGWSGGVVVPLNIRWSQLENEDAMRDCRAKRPAGRQGVRADRGRAGEDDRRPDAGVRR